MPAIATITVRPEISTDRPDVAAAASSAARSLRPGGAFLTLALQVEHRVVDADREPDQEHDRGHLVRRPAGRGSAARSARTSAKTAVSASSSGIPAATSAPNVTSEDDQRDRQREHPGLAEVVAVLAHSTAFWALASPELADEEARVGALGGRDGVEDRARSCRPPCPCRRGCRSRRAPRARPSRPVRRRTFWTTAHPRDARDDVARSPRRTRASPAPVAFGSGSGRSRRRGCLKPASRIRSIRPDSPGPDVFGSTFFVPTMPPMPKATTTRCEPAERRGLPVVRAPATHAGGQVASLLAVGGA